MPTGESPQTERLTPPERPHIPVGPNDLTLVGHTFSVTTSTPIPQRDRFPHLPGYAIQCELGRGGMGIVYRATQERLNRTVAVKMLLQQDVSDQSDVVRFRSEAEAVAAIPHPHVVKVYESDQHEGRPYFAMEYLSGGTLHAKLRATAPFTADDAAGLVEKLARAVHAAHSMGIVHRDLKPGNVLFDAAGEPRVTDFGLAKRTSQELTKTQAVMGTPAYMPPEQAAGRAKYVGPPADIYALGVILYECLTGSTPFTCEDSLALLNQVIADEPPSMRQKTPSVPRDLELICFKCLEKGPADRYQTAADLAEDLRRYSAREPVSVRPAGVLEKAVKWAKRRPTLATAYGLGVLAAALLLFGGGAAGLAVQAASARDDANRHWRASEVTRDQLEAQTHALAAARDQLAVKNQQANELLDREKDALAQATRSLDREKAARAEADRLRQAAVAGGYFHNVGFALREAQDGNFLRAQQLLDECPKDLRGWEWWHAYRNAHAESASGLLPMMGIDVAYDRDQKMVFGHVTGSLTVIDTMTGKSSTPANPPLLETHDRYYKTRLSADGSRALIVTRGNTDKAEAILWDVSAGKRLWAVKEAGGVAQHHALSADGTRAFVHAGGMMRCYDGVSGKLRGKTAAGGPSDAFLEPTTGGGEIAVIVDKGVSIWDGTDAPAGPVIPIPIPVGRPKTTALTDDGCTLLVGTSTGALVFHDRKTGKAVEHPTAHIGPVEIVRLSPDGKLAATGGTDGAVRVWDVATRALAHTFHGHKGDILSLRFDPTGKRVVATDNTFMLLTWDLDQKWHARMSATVPGHTAGLFFADKKLNRVFATTAPDMPGRVDDEKPYPLPAPTGQKYAAVAFSPVGPGVVVGGDGGRVEWRQEPTAKPVLVADLGAAASTLQFTPDGKRLLAASEKGWLVWDVGTGQVVDRTQAFGPVAAISPDGAKVAVTVHGMVLLYTVGKPGEFKQFQVSLRGGSNVAVTAVAFTPDSQRLLAGTPNEGVAEFVLSEDGSKPSRRYVGHTAAVTALGFNKAGDRLVSGAADGSVKLWDVTTTTEVVGLHVGRRVAVQEVWFNEKRQLLIAQPTGVPPVIFDGSPRPLALKPALP